MNSDLFNPNDSAVDIISPPDYKLFADVNFDEENDRPDKTNRDKEELESINHTIDILEVINNMNNSADIESFGKKNTLIL
jgi:hypothetical protein